MGKIRIESRLRAINPDKEESFSRRYAGDGTLIETRITCSECDYFDGCWERESHDNGRTWGEWQKIYSDEDGRRGRVPGSAEGDEYLVDGVTFENVNVNAQNPDWDRALIKNAVFKNVTLNGSKVE